MKAAARLVAASVAITLAPAAAEAQRAAYPSERDIPEGERARDTMSRFADCVVRARPDMTRDALAKTDFAESTKALNALVKRECLGRGELVMNPRVLRGALYRSLYIREFGRDAAPLQFADAGEAAAGSVPARSFNDCVVRAAPAAVRDFVVAEVATDRENQALAELGPAMAGCIDPREQLRFSPTVLEGILAEALYKNSVALAQGAGSAGRAE